jgi:S1-C subfamily serine protease
MRRFIDRVKPYLGVVVAIALVVPFGAGLVNFLLFDRAGDRAAEQLAESDIDAALVEAVLLVRATQCSAAGIGSGTAFATTLDGEPVLVTNRHVVDDARTVGVQRLGGGPGPRVTSWQLAPGADVAVLRLEDDPTLPVLLSLARDEPVVGSEVITVGFPNAMPFTNAGTIAAADDRRLDLDLRVEPGASGSPVLGPDGRVVGQVHSRTDDGNGVATALPALREALSNLDDERTGC